MIATHGLPAIIAVLSVHVNGTLLLNGVICGPLLIVAMKFAILVACVALLASPVLADVYGHGIIRFSNNRLNEQSANRDNGDRLFDSQVCIRPKHATDAHLTTS
jgi:hypothetical protein